MPFNAKKNTSPKIANATLTAPPVDAQLSLHTRLAQSWFSYPSKKNKIGLVQFAHLTTRMAKAAQADDPYAEWYLLKSWGVLLDSREKLKSIELHLATHLDNLRGIKINLPANSKHLIFRLQFSMPFGFIGANLLADADYIFRQIGMITHMGLVLEEEITVKQIVAYLRSAFTMPKHWRNTGITREDVTANTAKYQTAKALMGELPESVLKKEITLPFMLSSKKNKSQKPLAHHDEPTTQAAIQ